MTYLFTRHLHLTCVALSVLLLCTRGALALRGVDWRTRWPVLRWLPHANDSVLLLAGATLAVLTAQYPNAEHPWLIAKLALLLLYIFVGRQALRPACPAPRRAVWLLLALACVGSMVALAVVRPSHLF